MKKYIPLLYVPVMMFILVKISLIIEQNQPNYFMLGMGFSELLNIGIVMAEVCLYILFKRFRTPEYLVILILSSLAFPIPIFWFISQAVQSLPNGFSYLFTSPNAFVGMTLLSIELIQIVSRRISKPDKHLI